MRGLWIAGLGLALVTAGAAFFHRQPQELATTSPAIAQPLPSAQETPLLPVLREVPFLKAALEHTPSLLPLPLQLEGTVLDDDEALAFIRNLRNNEADFYRKGDLVQLAEVKDIRQGEVTLSLNGQTHRIYLEDAPVPPPIEEIDPSTRLIHKEGVLGLLAQEGTYDIKGPLKLTPQSDPDGHFLGYEMEGISFGTLPYWAGLRNGDLIKEVNHQALSTPQKAIQTFKKVRRLKQVEVGLVRNEKSMRLSYEVRSQNPLH